MGGKTFYNSWVGKDWPTCVVDLPGDLGIIMAINT